MQAAKNIHIDVSGREKRKRKTKIYVVTMGVNESFLINSIALSYWIQEDLIGLHGLVKTHAARKNSKSPKR